jgi:diguanylate cyclase (GGDEF)-like protein
MHRLVPRQAAWLIGVPVMLIAVAVFITANVERSTAVKAGSRQADSARLLTAMLKQDTGARGHLPTGEGAVLATWREGSSEFKHSLTLARWLTVEVAAALAILFGAGALLLMRRAARLEKERQRGQADLRELLQSSQSEQEARTLLVRHIERILPGSGAAVLNRDNADEKLQPLLSARASETSLKDIATGPLNPQSCLAVRLNHAHERAPGDQSLVECEVCGKVAANIACEPLLVGGEVIGAVLVAQEKKIRSDQRRGVHEAVTQAAPILANQRNLALAERRATSDLLTGLPNRRAADEALRRMAAHAARAENPLAAVLLDLDHFKQINDIHGHKTGDEVLAAIGALLTQSLRTSDFAARYGGEEFLLLLPDTDKEGAMIAAEKVRTAMERRGFSRMTTVTGSFGIAVLPDDAGEIDQLIREADRALYRAKARGRNRVETAGANDKDEPPAIEDLATVVKASDERSPFREIVIPVGGDSDAGDFLPTLRA